MRHFEIETKKRESRIRHEAHEALVATHFFLVAYKIFLKMKTRHEAHEA